VRLTVKRLEELLREHKVTLSIEGLTEKVLEARKTDPDLHLCENCRQVVVKILRRNHVPEALLGQVASEVGVLLTEKKEAEFLSHFTVTQGNPLGSRKEDQRPPTTFEDTMEGVTLDAVALGYVNEDLQEKEARA